MRTDDESADALAARLAATVGEFADGDDGADDREWTVRTDPNGVAVELPDRTLVVRQRDGPEGEDRWALDLRADGERVSAFGLFESLDDLDRTVRELLDADVRYTVCCDG